MSKIPDPNITALIEEAIRIAGSEVKLGKAAGYSQNAIWHAKRRGRVTAEMALAIDAATNGAVSRHRLRPDIFRAEVTMARTAA